MTFERSDTLLRDLIDKAVMKKEVQTLLEDEATLTTQDALTNGLLQASERLWGAVDVEIKQYEATERDVETDWKKFLAEHQPDDKMQQTLPETLEVIESKKIELKKIDEEIRLNRQGNNSANSDASDARVDVQSQRTEPPVRTRYVIPGAIAAGIVSYCGLCLATRDTLIGWHFSLQHPYLSVGIIAAVCALTAGAYKGVQALDMRWQSPEERILERLNNSKIGLREELIRLITYKYNVENQISMIQNEFYKTPSGHRLFESLTQIKKGLASAINSELKALLEVARSPSYATEWSVDDTIGLSRRLEYHPDLDGSPGNKLRKKMDAISTEARERIRYLLERMPGGSIGVSGPRGSGKSTLLWSLTNGSVQKVQEKPVLALMTPAPVDYVARDFILHIFSSICRQFLKINNLPEESPLPAHTDNISKFFSSPYIRSIQDYLLFLGRIFLFIGVFVPGLYALTKSELPVRATTSSPATANSQSPAKVVPPVITPKTKSDANIQTLRAWIEAMDFKPGSFLGLSLYCFLIFYFIRHIIAKEERRSRFNRKARDNASDINGPSFSEDVENLMGNLPGEKQAIAHEAYYWLQRVRFQQSYSSGWSGSLNLPVGMTGGFNTTVSLAQMQLSLPEIVEAYRKFIQQLSGSYCIVLAVDELDKIESDEKAQRFMNDLKVLFELPSCFYIISISENAMSGFERRGLPFRNAFDSALDTTIHVDYLNRHNVRKLIARRVSGMPMGFVLLCFCCSVGLARDLIRLSRELVRLVDQIPSLHNLSDLTYALLQSDIHSKLRAISIELGNIARPKEVSFVHDVLRRCASATNNRVSLIPLILELILFQEQSIAEADASEKQDEDIKKIIQRCKELGAYLYHCATILDIFSNSLTEQIILQYERDGLFDNLAYAWQCLSMNPQTSINTLYLMRLYPDHFSGQFLSISY